MYRSGKRWGHDLGLSTAFRQWRANGSHCSNIHGYALAVEVDFAAYTLDARNWVVDFGGLKTFKEWVFQTFDHRLLVAADDPMIDELCALGGLGIANPLVVDDVGCEAFAKMVFDYGVKWLAQQPYAHPVVLERATIREHGANWASYSAAGVNHGTA